METKQYPDMECDVVIAGCGVAGLYAALNLPTSTRVIMLSKGAIDECDSMLAQGGICVLPEGSDYDAFFEDTMHAGHYENRRESVDIMIRSSRSVINDLLAMGVDFERKADGSLDFTREGAHSRPRIAFHADITGKEITTKLLQAVRKLDNVQILEHVAMTDILTAERDDATVCTGVVAVAVDEGDSARPADELANAAEGVHAGKPFKIHARHTLWATGGIGGVYDHSTNYPQLTGDACYIAQEHGIKMEHLDYVQIHPTGLFSPQPGRTFLISESCRGEGAILLNAAGERFTDELQPRDEAGRHRARMAELCPRRARCGDRALYQHPRALPGGRSRYLGRAHSRYAHAALLYGRRVGRQGRSHLDARALRRGRDGLQRRSRQESPSF